MHPLCHAFPLLWCRTNAPVEERNCPWSFRKSNLFLQGMLYSAVASACLSNQNDISNTTSLYNYRGNIPFPSAIMIIGSGFDPFSLKSPLQAWPRCTPFFPLLFGKAFAVSNSILRISAMLSSTICQYIYIIANPPNLGLTPENLSSP